MIFKKIGGTDINVSAIALGTWAIGGVFWGGSDIKDSEKAISASLDEGINFIDTAPGYGFGLAEEIIGKVIKKKRNKVVISTKCGLIWDKIGKTLHYKFPIPGSNSYKDVYRDLSKESIENEIKMSLSRLQTDYIDIYITHWPDPLTPPQETMETLLKLKEDGIIRAIGVSNISIDTLKSFSSFGKLNVDQENYNILDREIEKDIILFCNDNNISILAYGALAQGLLTGKISPNRKFSNDDARILFYKKRFEPHNIQLANNLLEKYLGPIAQKHNCNIGNVAVASIIQDNSVIALCGARNEFQAKENAVSGRIILDSEDKNRIENFINEYNSHIKQ